MERLPLKLKFAVAVLLVGFATPLAAQNFEYTPYRGQNNTGLPSDAPPQDNYTPTHQGNGQFGAPSPGTPGQADQDDARQDGSSDDRDNGRAPASSGDAYAPPSGTYSPSEDVYSPSRDGRGTPPPPSSPPPRGVGGPPPPDFDDRPPRVEVQVAAPDDGVPLSVREGDARRAAIQGWRSKVADRYGPEFSQWRAAIDKRVNCHPDRRDGLVCTASGQPVRGFDRDGR
ncbi:hypothetical protein [Hyphomicrobium sp.]|uniref:hypothetical protein n=1 Tax=Hyphomicrobium sp. TaxID=82 RepID=UPI0035689529